MSDNPYKFTVKGTTFDFYDLSDAINFEQSAVEHAVKKLVALGKRSGNKSYMQDLHEAIQSLYRAKEQLDVSLRQTAGAARSPSEQHELLSAGDGVCPSSKHAFEPIEDSSNDDHIVELSTRSYRDAQEQVLKTQLARMAK